jgi:hypothetical protein
VLHELQAAICPGLRIALRNSEIPGLSQRGQRDIWLTTGLTDLPGLLKSASGTIICIYDIILCLFDRRFILRLHRK